METQKTLNSQNNLNRAVGIILPNFRLYNKAIVIKEYGTGTKPDTQINGAEQRIQTQTGTHWVYLIFRKGEVELGEGKGDLFSKGVGDYQVPNQKKSDCDHYFVPYTDANSRWIVDTFFQSKTKIF